MKQTLTDVLERAAQRHVALPSPPMRRALRLDNGLTQDDLAAVVGTDRATIARYESGTREPRGEARSEYARALAALAERRKVGD